MTTSDPYIQNLFADRIGGKQYGKGTEIYKFEKIKRAKRAALAANPGAELIDMGVGEPDAMACPECVEELDRAAADAASGGAWGRPRAMAPPGCAEELYGPAKAPANRIYADNGARPYQDAAARWMKN